MAGRFPTYVKLILALILIVALTLPLNIFGFILGLIGAHYIWKKL